MFTTILFNDTQNGIEDIYKKLLSDTLTVDLGYLYENVVAQAIKASGRDLYYHTWRKVGERFLLSQKDVGKIGTLKLKPIYMILSLLKDL